MPYQSFQEVLMKNNMDLRWANSKRKREEKPHNLQTTKQPPERGRNEYTVLVISLTNLNLKWAK